MKKTTPLILLVFFSCISVNAQVKEMILNKANDKLKQKQAEKSASDSTGTHIEGKNNSEEKTINRPGFNLTGVPKSEIRPEYNFTENIVSEIRTYKKNGEQDGEAQQVKYFFGKDSYIGMEIKTEDKKEKKTSTVLTIAELEKSITIMLTDDGESKTGFALKHDYSKIMEEAGDTAKHKVTVTKTGKTKVILGYKSEEYIITNEKGEKSNAWYTTEIPLDLYKSISAFAGKNENMNGYPGGFMMEMTQFNSNGEKTEWKVISVNLNAPSKVISSDYTFAGY